MAERRRCNRLSIKMPVKCKILERRKKDEISYEVVSKTRNFSEGGVSLTWPKAWNCKACLKCLAWIFNHACTLKEESQTEEFNRYLATSDLIQVELGSPALPESIKVTGRVAWVRPQDRADSYRIGLSFSEAEAGKLEKLQGEVFTLKDK